MFKVFYAASTMTEGGLYTGANISLLFTLPQFVIKMLIT